MTNTITPYEDFKAGDLIEAERMDSMQIKIKQDIATQVGQVNQVLQDHLKAPVDAATFGGKKPDEWKAELDQRYVMRAEIGEGWGKYLRYFKQLNRQLDGQVFGPALIEHNLQRYPLVTVFELVSLFEQKRGKGELKFFVYYAGHRDDDAESMTTRGLDVAHWGDSISTILDQFKLQVTPKQAFDDVLNDLWEHMFDPDLDQDHFRRDAYGQSDYVQQHILDKDRTVEELQQMGIWDDLRMAIRPRMIPTAIEYPAIVGQENSNNMVDIFHLSQNALEIRAKAAIDLMILLRT